MQRQPFSRCEAVESDHYDKTSVTQTHIKSPSSLSGDDDVLDVILTHQQAAAVHRMLSYWNKYGISAPLIAHGGHKADFDAIDHPNKIYVTNPRLTTHDHQRELQSITSVLKAVAEWAIIKGQRFEYLHFSEYDQIPLVDDLHLRLIKLMESKNADLLVYHPRRIEETSPPHWLSMSATAEYQQFISQLSVRDHKSVILSALGTGSFWKYDTFREVSAVEERLPMYFEVYLPTVAHHLGFRICSYDQQSEFVGSAGDKTKFIEEARARGAWTLHPVKHLFEQDS